jgi:hypothetical protein
MNKAIFIIALFFYNFLSLPAKCALEEVFTPTCAAVRGGTSDSSSDDEELWKSLLPLGTASGVASAGVGDGDKPKKKKKRHKKKGKQAKPADDRYEALLAEMFISVDKAEKPACSLSSLQEKILFGILINDRSTWEAFKIINKSLCFCMEAYNKTGNGTYVNMREEDLIPSVLCSREPKGFPFMVTILPYTEESYMDTIGEQVRIVSGFKLVLLDPDRTNKDTVFSAISSDVWFDLDRRFENRGRKDCGCWDTSFIGALLTYKEEQFKSTLFLQNSAKERLEGRPPTREELLKKLAAKRAAKKNGR